MIFTYEKPKTRQELAEEVVRRLEDLYSVLPEGVKVWLDHHWDERHDNPEDICWAVFFGISLDDRFDDVAIRQREYLVNDALGPWAELAMPEDDNARA